MKTDESSTREQLFGEMRSNRLNTILREAMALLLERAADEERERKKMAPTVLAIRHVEAILTNSGVGHGCVCGCPVIDGHTGDCPVVAFLPEA